MWASCLSLTARAILQNCGLLQIITFLIVLNTSDTIWKTNMSETQILTTCEELSEPEGDIFLVPEEVIVYAFPQT